MPDRTQFPVAVRPSRTVRGRTGEFLFRAGTLTSSTRMVDTQRTPERSPRMGACKDTERRNEEAKLEDQIDADDSSPFVETYRSKTCARNGQRQLQPPHDESPLVRKPIDVLTKRLARAMGGSGDPEGI